MIYTRTINNRQVFSDCRTIQTNNGTWISNPTAEQIADAGWEVYIPPVTPEQPRVEPDYTDILSAVKKLLANSVDQLSDEDALDVAALYPTWKSKLDNGDNAVVGDRMWYNGKLWKVIQNHTMQSEWTPDVATSLYTEVGISEWPDWRQPVAAEDAYNTGDKVTWNNKHWVSNSDNNVWEPGVYGWDEQ